VDIGENHILYLDGADIGDHLQAMTMTTTTITVVLPHPESPVRAPLENLERDPRARQANLVSLRGSLESRPLKTCLRLNTTPSGMNMVTLTDGAMDGITTDGMDLSPHREAVERVVRVEVERAAKVEVEAGRVAKVEAEAGRAARVDPLVHLDLLEMAGRGGEHHPTSIREWAETNYHHPTSEPT